VAVEQVGRALNVLTGLCELVRGGLLTDREGSMLSAALREAYTQDMAPLIEDVVAIIAARHPRVRAMSLDRGEDTRYDDTVENLLASLMALGPDGRFGDTFSRPTTIPMLLDRAVVFDVSGIGTAETKLQAGVQLVCWSYGQSAVSAAKEWSRRSVMHIGTWTVGTVGVLTSAAFLLYPPAWAPAGLLGAGGFLTVTGVFCMAWRSLNPVFPSAGDEPAGATGHDR